MSQTLKRQLGFWDSVAINVGVIIGVGIFRTPGAIAEFLNSPGLILLTWFLGALVCLAGVLCFAELASLLPHTGGIYIYLREAFGRPAGFIFGWAEFIIMRAGSVAGVAYILAAYLQNFIPVGEGKEKLLTLAAIALFTLLNILGVKLGARVQNALSLLKIVTILGMTAVIFIFPTPAPPVVSAVPHFAGIAPALIPVLWTYGGWHQSTFMSGEFQDTKKALPLSLVTGIGIVAAVYMLINAAYLKVLSPAEMASTQTIASDIFMQLFGPLGMTLVSVIVLISASGALNSTIMTGARIPFAVAQDYPRFGWFSKVDPRFGTPARCYLINGIWAGVLVLWGNFDQLLFFFAFSNWLFFALTGASIFVLRKKMTESHKQERYSLPGYPWVPVIFILSSVALCLITVHSAPVESLFGAVLLLLGIPLYFIFRGKTA